MKTTKLVIGIVSMVLFLVVTLQSCAAGIGNALSENGEASGSAGVVLAICMLVAGIVGLVTRKGGAGGFVAGGFYAIGGIIGVANYGSYSDLLIWSIVSFAFAAFFIVGTALTKGKKSENEVSSEESK